MAVQEPGIVDLIRTALSDANDLIRSEIALAKAELRQDVSRLQIGVAAFAGAAIAAVVGVVMLLTTMAWAIAEGFRWPTWAGFAIVTVLTFIAAIALAIIGKRRFAAHKPMPLTADTMKENATWIRARTS
jgi:NADH:ubiquinone oxidoreductase subunit 6 (subunit J)